MRTIHHNNLFRWTLTEKPYLILALGSIALLILALEVL